MADDRLRLTAELIDRVSGPAKRMAKSFEDLKKASAKDLPDAFKKYQSAVASNEKALQNYGKRTLSIGRELKAFQDIVRRTSPAIAGLTDSIGAFGVGAGAAIGVVAAIGTALVLAGKSAAKFASDMRDLRFASRETGFSISQIRQLQLLGPAFGISAEKMTEGLDSFSNAMLEAHRNAGKFQTELAQALGPAGLKYASNLLVMARHGATAADELEELSKIFEKIKKDIPGAEGERLAGKMAQAFGLPAEFGRLSGADLKDKLAKIKELGFSPEELAEASKNAEKLNKILFEGGLILDRWGVTLENKIIKDILQLYDESKKLIDLWSNAPPGSAAAMQNMFGGGGSSAPGGGTFAPFTRGGGGGGGDGAATFGGGDKSFGGRGGGGGGGGRGPGTIGNILPQLLGGGGDVQARVAAGAAAAGTVGGFGGLAGSGVSAVAPSAGALGGLGGVFSGGGGAGVAGALSAFGRGKAPPSTPGGTGAVDGGGMGGGTGINRDAMLAELTANPGLKEQLFRHAIGENSDPLANQAVMEEAANRHALRSQLTGHQGFGADSNLSYFQGYRNFSAKERAMMEANFDKVFRQGSDISGGAIDNSSQWLSAKHERTGRFRTTANFGGDRITGHHGVESFEVPGWGESMSGERAAYPEFRRKQLEEAAQRNNPMARLNVNQALSGGGPTSVDTSGEMSVKVSAPQGTEVRTGGRLFQRQRIQRNMQMPDTNTPVPQQQTPFG